MVIALFARPTGRAVLRISSRFLALLLAALLASGRAWAGDVGYIRDAEIESTLRSFYTPILEAAGLEPTAVHIYIVNDPSLNSFVAGGQNIFINTGTIMRSETPNQLIGIVAHENLCDMPQYIARCFYRMQLNCISLILIVKNEYDQN